MKPIRIAFQCFGAYPGEVSIDLQDVGRDGLFLISGDTGAGKTTLLDAMCCALYNSSSSGTSNDPGKGDLETMRSRFADPADKKTVTYVELDLQKDGELYRFRRELKPKPRADGFVDTHEVFRWIDGTWKPILANPKAKSVTDQAILITGLSPDQFRQIIILPQGRFEKLLVSDSQEKEEILKTIFGTDQWAHAVRLLKETVDNEGKRLASKEDEIRGRLQQLECGSLDELNEKIQRCREELPEWKKAYETADAQLRNINEQLKSAMAVENLFVEAEKRAAEVNRLQRLADSFQQKEEQLQTARRAESLQESFVKLTAQRDELVKQKEKANEAGKQAKQAASVAEQAGQQWNRHEATRPKYQQGKERLQRMIDAVSAYQDFSKHRQQYDQADVQYREAEKKKRQAEKAKNDAGMLLIQTQQANDQRSKELNELRRRYTLNAAGFLAQSLKEDAPCPVCGSLHHPAKAVLTDDHVTDRQLEQAEKDAEQADRAFKKAFDDERVKRDAYTAADGQVIKAGEALKGIQQLLEADQKHLIEGIASEEELNRQVNRYRCAVENFEAAEVTLKQALEQAEKTKNSLQGAANQAAQSVRELEAELAAAEQNWLSLLAEKGFADEQDYRRNQLAPARLEALRGECDQYKADCKHAEDELKRQRDQTAEKVRPDMKALQETQTAADDARNEALGKQQTAERELKNLEKTQRELAETLAELEQKRQEYTRRSAFVGQLNGVKMNLHRYVLAAMLDLVIGQANQLLASVHHGRFTLQRAENATGAKRKAGLELLVHDNRTDCEGSVKSLSGGEKFLVSLALAIGMNTVMQAQAHGIRVEAIFVDEGFGSLDTDSIDDAMRMLNTVRMSHGLVGVISHIEALRAEIPVHIEVHKDTVHGSTLTCG